MGAEGAATAAFAGGEGRERPPRPPAFLMNLRFIKLAQTYGFKASSVMAKDYG